MEVQKLEVISQGRVDKEDGKLTFKQIVHRPKITVQLNANATKEKLTELAIRAEKACFISNTLRSSIQFTVEPDVVVI